MRKIKEIVIWVLLISFLVTTLGFVSAKRKQILCNEVEVYIIDKTNNNFVEEDDIISLINDKGRKILGTSLDSLNLTKLETLIYNHPSVKKAEIYNTINGKLKIDIKQRKPILRIINYNRESYYIDSEGALMPLSDNYTAHVLVANGDLNEPYLLRYTKDIISFTDYDELNRKFVLRDLYFLAKFINDDNFWLAQIEQIFVIGNEYELIPRVGPQIIEFGNIENYREKFRNLKALYEVGLKSEGWNKYKKINLKYNNQVICTKR
ncbi:MAG: hypothetical protein KAT68_12530 [Bacteroidales bacterium]|nr:hypothetical protein [Bacteroidales bacterium]